MGFSKGDNVYVKSPIGLMPAVLQLDDGLHPDVLLAPRGGWLKTGRCVNALVSPKVSDKGHTAAYYSQKVTLLPSEEIPF
jgi:anaerobic selenocysteine-containing dehydrogenase